MDLQSLEIDLVNSICLGARVVSERILVRRGDLLRAVC